MPAKSSQGGSAQGFTNNHLISILKIVRWQLHHKYSVSQLSSLTQETGFPNYGFLSCCPSTVPHASPNSPCVGEDGTIHSREPLMSARRGATEQSSKRDKRKLQIPLGTEISCSVSLTKPQPKPRNQLCHSSTPLRRLKKTHQVTTRLSQLLLRILSFYYTGFIYITII